MSIANSANGVRGAGVEHAGVVWDEAGRVGGFRALYRQP
eukprot:COSAG01_NODE_60790_length_292_cov_7.150259_1_plen_38_part_01